MSGLLMKDYRLLTKRKSFLALMVVLVMGIGGMMDGTFIISYLPLLVTIFTLSTISYDEFENGMPFIMTLPIDGTIYAVEKYVLGGILGGGSLVVAVVIQVLSFLLRYGVADYADCVISAMAILPICMLMLAILLPVELKFGPEKGRLVMFIIYGTGLLLYCLGKNMLLTFGVNQSVLLETIAKTPELVMNLVFTVIAIILLAISIVISVNIMKKREF